MESLINSTSNGYLWQTCENMKKNLSFLQKELLVENEPIKSLLETQICNSQISNSNSTSTPVSCHHHITVVFKMMKNIWKIKQIKSIKHKVKQSKYKQKKNMSNLYMGSFNPSIKEINLVELLGLNTTKYLRETCSLNMPLNDNRG